MQNIIKQEVHDFILKSCKEVEHTCCSDRNDQIVIRNVSVIEKYFLEGAKPIEIKEEFAIATTDDVWDITDRYLAHLSFVARHDGYTPDELNLISELLKARRSKRKEIIDCVNVIDTYKKEHKQNNLVFSVSDPIEKLYASNIISINTFFCLRPEYNWIRGKSETTIESIIYVPKMWLCDIPNMGDKRTEEIVSFMNNYTIQGRIIPSKEDIKRVLKNTIGTTVADNDNIINMYFLTDASVDNMCEHLQLELSYIQAFIDRVLMRVMCTACRNEWSLLDLITLSSMIDLYSARQGTYKPRNYDLEYITSRIRDLLSSKDRN